MLPPDATAGGLSALMGTMIGLTTITLALRFYSRMRQKKAFLTDDWLTIPAWVTFVSACAVFFNLIKLRVLGYSSFEVSKLELMKSLEKTQKQTIVGNILLTFALGCIKASAVFFYRRIFCSSGRNVTFNVILLITALLIALWTAGYVIFIGVQCKDHFSALWDGTQPKYCQWAFPVIYGEAVSDFIFDVWILVLPIPLIIRLHTTLTRKLSIISVFLLGYASLAASIARLVKFTQINNAGSAAYHMDHEKYSTQTIFYMVLEAGIGLTTINLPSIWSMATAVSPDGWLQSIRSAVSLASFGSRGSRVSRGSTRQNTNAIKSATSVSSGAPRPVGSPSRLPSHDDSFDVETLRKDDSRSYVQNSVRQEKSKAGQV